MAEDAQLQTLQQRIAALNADHLGRLPGKTIQTRPKPPIPDRRPILKHKSFNIPNENAVSTSSDPANLPNGPPQKQPPPLPARRNKQEADWEIGTIQRNDNCSRPQATATRTKSEQTSSRIKAPAWGQCDLPTLPLKTEPLHTRKESVVERPSTARTPSVSSLASTTTTASSISHSTIPPPLPSRKSTDNTSVSATRRLPPLATAKDLDRVRKASFANVETVELAESPPPLPVRRPSGIPSEQAVHGLEGVDPPNKPPPVPRASRPNLAAIQATKPKLNSSLQALTPAATATGCMVCRDFSGPDSHARKFPRQQVVSLPHLAQQLVAPFVSPTDKARAIFTWLHLNIAYNTHDFFCGNIKGSTPQSTFQTGLAVCEGYAALFTCLATHAGLESRVITGHGKGFGHNPLKPGEPLPSYNGNHAWNVVKIDNGEWKLIDSCWGAGYVQGAGMPYVQKFAPERFTQSNEEFGIDHFPNDRDGFYTAKTMSWEEYIQIDPARWPYSFERPTLFDNAKSDYCIGKHSVMPPARKISIYEQETVRFQFGLFCPHWRLDPQKQIPPVFILAAGGVDGREKHYIPIEHVKGSGKSGDLWYVDVPARTLGAPGELLTLFAVTSFGDRQDARGLSVQEFRTGVGRVAMGFVGVAAWELV